MRLGILIFGSMLLVGCAGQAPETVTQHYAPAASSALVFDPPIARGEERIDLPREQREKSAFVGYEETTTTFYYLRIDDRQDQFGSHGWDRYNRQAYTERSSVSYR